jgi:hypothetical protein
MIYTLKKGAVRKMKNSFNVCRLFLIPFFLLVIISCEEQITTAPNPVVGDVFIFDTIQVNIRYDATPGFKYPLMNYDIYTVTRLTKDGWVDGYEFKCPQGNIDTWIAIDYFNYPKVGTIFRRRINKWNDFILQPSAKVAYTLIFTATLPGENKEFTFNGNEINKYYTAGIQPEPNSLQLTGPENRNYNPNFSPDGNWIYFQSSHNQRTIFKTDKHGNSYEKIADFTDSQLDQGAYGILDNNHLVYVQNGGQLSSIVIKDLGTMNDLVYPVNGNLWGTEPVKIPNTNKFLNFTDPNKAIDFNYKLVTADIVTQKVDTILKNFYGDVEEYTINPHNNNIYLLTVSNHYDIIEYNPATEKFSIFLGNVNYIRNLKFFPNNNNYAYIRKDQNGYYNIFLNINGIEKQLTKYPGDVTGFSISPDGNFIAFSANRRDEIQSWVISIN